MTPEAFEKLITSLLKKAKEFYEQGEDAKMDVITNWMAGALFTANKMGICTSQAFIASTFKTVRELRTSVEMKKREVDAVIALYERQLSER